MIRLHINSHMFYQATEDTVAVSHYFVSWNKGYVPPVAYPGEIHDCLRYIRLSPNIFVYIRISSFMVDFRWESWFSQIWFFKSGAEPRFDVPLKIECVACGRCFTLSPDWPPSIMVGTPAYIGHKIARKDTAKYAIPETRRTLECHILLMRNQLPGTGKESSISPL